MTSSNEEKKSGLSRNAAVRIGAAIGVATGAALGGVVDSAMDSTPSGIRVGIVVGGVIGFAVMLHRKPGGPADKPPQPPAGGGD